MWIQFECYVNFLFFQVIWLEYSSEILWEPSIYESILSSLCGMHMESSKSWNFMCLSNLCLQATYTAFKTCFKVSKAYILTSRIFPSILKLMFLVDRREMYKEYFE